MNILDYVIPKKGWGYLMPQTGAGEEEEPQTADSILPEPASRRGRGPCTGQRPGRSPRR